MTIGAFGQRGRTNLQSIVQWYAICHRYNEMDTFIENIQNSILCKSRRYKE